MLKSPLTYAEINQEIQDVEKKTRALTEQYNKEKSLLTSQLNSLLSIRNLIEKGLDAEAAQIGREIISVRIPDYHTQECINVMNHAIKDIRHGALGLKQEYFGVKQYASWNSQEVDCSYGMGPTYGSVWFSVEMNQEYRDKDLTDEQKIACVRYLQFILNELEKTPKHGTTD